MKPLISSVKIEFMGNHARLSVFNRGAKAGVLTVNKEDAFPVATRLVPDKEEFICFNEWKFSYCQNDDFWFGFRSSDEDYWELRIITNAYNVVWEVWDYSKEMSGYGTEESLNDAFLVAMDYVNQVELE